MGRPLKRHLVTAVKTSKWWFVVVWLAGLLLACDIGPRPSTGTGVALPNTMTRAEPTMKEQLAELDRTGELPALDRSTDIAGPDANTGSFRRSC